MHNLVQNRRLLLGVAIAIVLAVVVLLIVLYSGGGQTGPSY
jgi:hypothetical protein